MEIRALTSVKKKVGIKEAFGPRLRKNFSPGVKKLVEKLGLRGTLDLGGSWGQTALLH